MKKLLFLLFLMPAIASAQKFFVEKSDEGMERPIINKLLENNVRVVFKEDSADFVIKPIINEVRKDKARGYILISNSKSGEIVSKTNQESATSTIYNGLQNPKIRVVNKIVDKSLILAIKELSNK